LASAAGAALGFDQVACGTHAASASHRRTARISVVFLVQPRAGAGPHAREVEAVDQVAQPPHMAMDSGLGRRRRLVELAVPAIQSATARALSSAAYGLHAVGAGGRVQGYGLREHVRLHQQAQVEPFAQVRFGCGAHEHALVGNHVHQALRLQLEQGLAHGDSADAELSRDLLLPQRCA
jgi:hypothetical protein